MISFARPHDVVAVLFRHRFVTAILTAALLVIIGASLPETFPVVAIRSVCVRSLGVVYLAVFGVLLAAVLDRRDYSICKSPPYLIALALAIPIALFTGWTNDDLQKYYQVWGQAVLAGGLPSLYEHLPGAVNYPPVYPAILGVAAFFANVTGSAADQYHAAFFYRLVPIVGLFLLPIITGALVREIRGMPPGANVDTIVALVTVANPAFFYISVPWGQTDIAVMDFMLLSALAFLRGRPARAGAAIGFALLLKLQAAFIVPALLGWLLAKRDRSTVVRAAMGFVAAMAIVVPVTIGHGGLIGGYAWLVQLYRFIGFSYTIVSGYATTFFLFLSGPVLTYDYQPAPFGGTYLQESLLLDAVVGVGLIVTSTRGIRTGGAAAFAWYMALSTTLAYYCSVHVHERYLTYGAVSAIVWALVSPSRLSRIAAAIFSLVLFAQSLPAFDIPIGPWRARSLVLDHFTVSAYFTVLMFLLLIGIMCLIASGPARPKRRRRHAPAMSPSQSAVS